MTAATAARRRRLATETTTVTLPEQDIKQHHHPPSNQNDDNLIIDTDDQERLILNMMTEMEYQQQLICSAFRVVCIGAAVVTLLASLLVTMRLDKNSNNSFVAKTVLTGSARISRWIHTMLSAGLHVSATYTASSLPPASIFKWIWYIPAFGMLIVASNALFVIRKATLLSHHDDPNGPIVVWLHQGMLLANLFTAVVGHWLRWDAMSIQDSLKDLKASKYGYKSL